MQKKYSPQEDYQSMFSSSAFLAVTWDEIDFMTLGRTPSVTVRFEMIR